MLKPHQRMDDWLERRGYADLEELITYCGYDRAWAHSQIQALRRWVYANPVKGNKKQWKRFFGNNLSRSWDKMEDHEKPKSEERNWDRPPPT